MLILKLNRYFEIYSFNDHNLKLELALRPETGEMLELFKKFEDIWQETIWDLIKNQTQVKILFVIGSQAGFTDARVISIWLNSLSVFDQGLEVLIAKHLEYHQNPDEEAYLSSNISNILENKKWAKTLESAIYTREPSINQPKH
jgi:hypothetical protein